MMKICGLVQTWLLFKRPQCRQLYEQCGITYAQSLLIEQPEEVLVFLEKEFQWANARVDLKELSCWKLLYIREYYKNFYKKNPDALTVEESTLLTDWLIDKYKKLKGRYGREDAEYLMEFRY